MTVLTKPKYRVPTMQEIRDLPWNGYTVASTFSGCGGSCLGYRMAGYKVAYALEFIPEAQRTYKANHPDSYLDTSDIRDLQPEQLLERAGVSKGELDILDGSPPCSAFSTAGSREKGWGKVKDYSDGAQRVDDLFYEYARILEGVQPKVFVAENVTGLVKGTAKGYFKRIMQRLRDCGYNVSCKVLDARWLGVPQARQRTIFIGVRNDLNLSPVHPSPFPYTYTVQEAIDGCLPPAEDELHGISEGTKYHRLWLKTVPGSNFADACKAESGKGSFFNVCKVHPRKPAPTITASCMHFHWDQWRYMTIPEIKRICSFPDDFSLTGQFTKRWERMGRAVPPLMMKQVAHTIDKEILSCVA